MEFKRTQLVSFEKPPYPCTTNQQTNAPSQFHFRTKSWNITQVLNPCFLILLVNYSYSYGFLRIEVVFYLSSGSPL